MHQSMRDARKQGRMNVRLARIATRPRTIAYHSIPDDPADWHCRVVAQFYGLETVASEPR